MLRQKSNKNTDVTRWIQIQVRKEENDPETIILFNLFASICLVMPRTDIFPHKQTILMFEFKFT